MPPESLTQVLQAQHERAMIRQAETIRDWPIARERQEQAEIQVRSALCRQGHFEFEPMLFIAKADPKLPPNVEFLLQQTDWA